MNVLLLDESEELRRVRERMLKGWVLLDCQNSKLLRQFEELVYPPGTETNADFELMTIATNTGIQSIGFCKPSSKLDEFVQGDSSKAIIMQLVRLDSQMIAGYIQDYVETREKGVDVFIEKYYKPWMKERKGREGTKP